MPARKRASRGNVTKPQATPVAVSRAPEAAVQRALQLASGDRRRLEAQLEPDGRVSVTVLNHPRQIG